MLNKIKRFIKKLLFIIRRNLYWPYFLFFAKKPNVLSAEETIRFIVDNELSVSRFGEGEFKLMSKRGKIGFQEANDNLSNALLNSFAKRDAKLLVCSNNFSTKHHMNVESGRWFKDYVYIYFRHFNFFDRKYKYGDADITRFYQPDSFKYTNFDYLEKQYVPLLRSIWNDKNLLIVEGSLTKLGLGNDLFSNAKTIRRIECPPKNAFSKYNQIIESILKNVRKDELVLIALGPTASVLSVDLWCNYKIRSIDIGHIDVVYMWFLNKTKEKFNIDGKYVNEAIGSSNILACEFDRTKFQSEIIDIID